MRIIRNIMMLMSIFISISATAQQSDFQKACARYKNFKQAGANVTRIIHKKSLKKDIVTTGGAFIMHPDMVSISTNEGLDKLLMKGTRFTMTVNGKEHSTDSRKNPQFATFHTVLSSVINGGTTDISKLPDVSIQKTGTSLSITITPIINKVKKKKRMMYSKFVLVLDMKTSAFKLLRFVERDGGFTDYEFSKFSFE
jgi:hypothetical protein